MTEQPSSATPLEPEDVAALLASAMRARRNGNLSAARALLRALAADQPNQTQIWLALATVAETRAEQRQALERVAALDPSNPLAQRGLAHIRAATHTAAPAPAERPIGTAARGRAVSALPSAPAARTALAVAPAQAEPGVGPAPALTPRLSEEEAAARAIRWPLYMVIGISILAVLAAALLIRDGNANVTAIPTPPLPGAATPIVRGAATQQVAPTLPALPATSSPVVDIIPSATEAATLAPSPTATRIPPTPAPTVTPRPTLAIGEVVKQGVWHAVLLRPDYAVPLDGSIDTFQPNGRFILALVAVGNDGPASAPVPVDLFALVDQTGTRYAPLPAVSTAYLNTYGRGQRGDLSMEDPIPADGGNKSVPLIFDVPENARDLYLMVKDNVAGWPVRQ